jgi:hypothetical protein
MLLFWVFNSVYIDTYHRIGKKILSSLALDLSPEDGDVSPKLLYLPTILHGITNKKKIIVILSTVRTSNVTVLRFIAMFKRTNYDRRM